MDDATRSCCAVKKTEETPERAHDHKHEKTKKDYIYFGSIIVITLSLFVHFLFAAAPDWLHLFAQAIIDILATMWWGVALGIVVVGLMAKMPREYFIGLLGKENGVSGILRAVFGGVVLDLCSHGILLVAAKLYERGVSLPQVMAFLVASPWNSISLTLILIAFIGLPWTAVYILCSALIAFLTGLAFQALIRNGVIPDNPNKAEIPDDFKLGSATMVQIKRIRFSPAGMMEILKSGWADGQMIIKWLLFGTIIAAATRTFIPHEMFADWFGPTMTGLLLTVLAATVIEICSEGSAPMAGEFMTRAAAPGNGFAFLMAGVATDYTEILVVRQFTGSWKIAFLLPLITVPQVILLAWIMNLAMVP